MPDRLRPSPRTLRSPPRPWPRPLRHRAVVIGTSRSILNLDPRHQSRTMMRGPSCRGRKTTLGTRTTSPRSVQMRKRQEKAPLTNAQTVEEALRRLEHNVPDRQQHNGFLPAQQRHPFHHGRLWCHQSAAVFPAHLGIPDWIRLGSHDMYVRCSGRKNHLIS